MAPHDLLDQSGQTTLAPVLGDAPPVVVPSVAGDPFVAMVERLAGNKDVDVEKLDRIITAQMRILDRHAKADFDAAYAAMQPELPAITEKGEIIVKGSLRSRYAKLEDIQAAIKPVLARFGFAIRHRTEWPDGKDGIIRIVGILSHRSGHSEESAFEAPMDRSEYRTDVQSQGSTVSYGRRYTTIDLLNIETRGVDDDGAKAGRPTPPAGYDEFKLALSEAANHGRAELDKAFQTASKEHRTYLTQCDAQDFAKMRNRANGGRS